jgi:RNA polymerase-binding transcription factor DksA
MAVKNAISAAKKAVQPKKAGPTKAASTTATGTRMTTKASETKVTTKTPAKTAKAAKATTKASATTVAKTRATTVTAAKTAAKTRPTKTTTPRTTATKKAAGRGSGVDLPTRVSTQPQRLRVLENEKPWTVKELATVHTELESDVARLQKEISVAELDLAGLMRDVGDGAGDDPADAGTATFEREQEISLANNAREVFEQSTRALARLLDGSYGICESCGNPIGKNRLLAFPRATLCMSCKSKQERR